MIFVWPSAITCAAQSSSESHIVGWGGEPPQPSPHSTLHTHSVQYSFQNTVQCARYHVVYRSYYIVSYILHRTVYPALYTVYLKLHCTSHFVVFCTVHITILFKAGNVDLRYTQAVLFTHCVFTTHSSKGIVSKQPVGKRVPSNCGDFEFSDSRLRRALVLQLFHHCPLPISVGDQ